MWSYQANSRAGDGPQSGGKEPIMDRKLDVAADARGRRDVSAGPGHKLPTHDNNLGGNNAYL